MSTFISTQMITKKGVKEFGDDAANAIITEFTQFDEKQIFRPRHPTELTREDMRKSVRLIMCIKNKAMQSNQGKGICRWKSTERVNPEGKYNVSYSGH